MLDQKIPALRESKCEKQRPAQQILLNENESENERIWGGI